MPTYGYRCTVCGYEFEQVQKMTDASLTECPNCGNLIKRIMYPVGIAFKGSGFYVTDYGKAIPKEDGGATPATAETKSEGKTETNTPTESSALTETAKPETKTESAPSTPSASPAKTE